MADLAQYAAAQQAVLQAHTGLDRACRDHGGARAAPLDDEPEAAAVTEARSSLASAASQLREAEGVLPDGLLDAAWEANRRAVQEAKQARTEALRRLGKVEARSGDAARSRDPKRPVMSSAEKASIDAAVRSYQATDEALTTAVAIFKGGVTAEQLEAVR